MGLNLGGNVKGVNKTGIFEINVLLGPIVNKSEDFVTFCIAEVGKTLRGVIVIVLNVIILYHELVVIGTDNVFADVKLGCTEVVDNLVKVDRDGVFITDGKFEDALKFCVAGFKVENKIGAENNLLVCNLFSIFCVEVFNVLVAKEEFVLSFKVVVGKEEKL